LRFPGGVGVLANSGPGVDVVYLWVDGSDPVWRAKRACAQAQLENRSAHLAAFANVEGRYRDNGELRFNLRALERFFPDHGHVYLVTDGQQPKWLRPSSKLTVVDHKTLLPPSSAVFDSANIETWLHHIPGLSERFIYLNDDTFFGAPLDAARWFGQPMRVFTESAPATGQGELQPLALAPVNASILSRQWLTAKYLGYVHQPHVYTHAPRSMLKSAMFELEALAPELFQQSRETSFRTWSAPALIPDLVPRWMVHMGLAVEEPLNPLHLSTGDADATAQFAALVQSFGTLPFFCINDTCDDAAGDDARLKLVVEVLERLLPEASAFERGDVSQGQRAAAYLQQSGFR